MASYSEWSDALAGRFFNAGASGNPVHLFVTEDLVAEVGVSLGSPPDEFVDVVLQGPPWATREGLCQRALQAMDGWRARGHELPPYLGYLAAFVLAAGLEGEFAVHAYHPRLHRLLGIPGDRALPSFDRMDELWQDLEVWSTRDRDGSLGIFSARSIGSFIHIGYPIAQAILTAHERRALPQIFGISGFDPAFPPPRGELARQLRLRGRGEFRTRTLEILGGPAGDTRDAVLDAVLEELVEWDGRLGSSDPDGLPDARPAAGVVRLSLTLDPVARLARLSARCRVADLFPEERISLRSSGSPELWCEGEVAGWSTTLRHKADGSEFDAGALAGRSGAVFTDTSRGWEFRLGAATARLFVEGASEGLPGLVETVRLPATGPVYLVATTAAWLQLSSWAERSGECTVLQLAGIPSSLVVAKLLDYPADSAALERAFPFLEASILVRLRYRGGLRASSGNSFFSFVPPLVVADGTDPADQITCAGLPLEQTEDPGVFTLPAGLPTETQLWIEVVRAGQPLKRQSLYLVTEFDWRQRGRVAGPEGAAIVAEDDAVRGEGTGEFHFERSVLTAAGFRAGAHYDLVGSRPGEIQEWPDEGIPIGWSPVWAVPRRRRAQAVYCGTDISAEAPRRMPQSGASRRAIRRWRESLWLRRKTVRSPTNAMLARLWRSYQTTARDVRTR